MRNTLLILVTLAFPTGLLAADYERRLIPVVVYQSPGALGTVWTTEVFALYDRRGIVVPGLVNYGDVGPPPLNPLEGEMTNPLPYYTEAGAPPGSVVYVNREVSADVHLVASILAGRDGDDVYLPVVPESSFTSRTFYFLGLVDSPMERLMLRVYSLDVEQQDAAVRVRLTTHDSTKIPHVKVLRELVVPLAVRQKVVTALTNVGLRERFAIRPLAAEIPLDGLLAGLNLGSTPFAVWIDPVSPGLKLWGFISETDNATQRVQIILPQ